MFPGRRLSGHMTLLAVLALGLLFSCKSKEERSSGSESQLLEQKQLHAMTMAGPTNISMLPIVADKRGFFRLEGVALSFQSIQTGKQAMDAVVSGQIDIGVVVDTNIAHALFTEGVDLVVLCSVMEKTDDALVVRTDHGITKPADLKGRKIAYLPATTSDSFLWRFFRAKGIERSALTLLPTTPPALQIAVLKGDVDAGAIWEPWRFNIVKALGDSAAIFPNEGLYRAQAVLAVQRGTLAAHRQELAAVMRALIRAEAYTRAELGRTQSILAAAVPIDSMALASTWSLYSPRVRLPSVLLENLETEAEYLRTNVPAFTGRDRPDFRSAMDGSVLRAVASERVEVGF